MNTARLQALAGDQFTRAVTMFEQAIGKSFDTDDPKMKNITKGETADRFNHCLRIFTVLRKDKQWSWARIEDHLPGLLRKQLDGIDWEKNLGNQRIWLPESHNPDFRGILGS
jgi:hypothetical protein